MRKFLYQFIAFTLLFTFSFTVIENPEQPNHSCGIFFNRRPSAGSGGDSDTMKPGEPVGKYASTVRISCDYGNGSGCYGSGVIVIWGCETRILTARHVIEKAKRIRIKSSIGNEFDATVIASSDWDCAVLAPSQEIVGICPSQLATQDEVESMKTDVLEACGYGSKGSFAVDIGHFLGYQSKGRENGESQPSDTVADWITIDGSCRQGDSGGPIFNSQGHVVGILWGTNGRIVIGVQAGRLGILLNEAEEKGQP